MHVKKGFILLLVACFMLFSCNSTKRVDGDILDYQRQISVLEARISNYERTIARAVTELESIRRRASNIDGTIDEIIELFDDYQRTVEQLLRDYREAAEAIRQGNEDSTYPDVGPDN